MYLDKTETSSTLETGWREQWRTENTHLLRYLTHTGGFTIMMRILHGPINLNLHLNSELILNNIISYGINCCWILTNLYILSISAHMTPKLFSWKYKMIEKDIWFYKWLNNSIWNCTILRNFLLLETSNCWENAVREKREHIYGLKQKDWGLVL